MDFDEPRSVFIDFTPVFECFLMIPKPVLAMNGKRVQEELTYLSFQKVHKHF